MNYATIEDIEARWKPLTDAEKRKAEVLISEATSKIRVKARSEGKDFDTMIMNDEDLRNVTVGIVCTAIKSCMTMRADAIGASQWSASVGGYSESVSYANPSGGLRFSRKDYQSIGLGRQKFGGLDVYGMDREQRANCFAIEEDCDRL